MYMALTSRKSHRIEEVAIEYLKLFFKFRRILFLRLFLDNSPRSLCWPETTFCLVLFLGICFRLIGPVDQRRHFAVLFVGLFLGWLVLLTRDDISFRPVPRTFPWLVLLTRDNFLFVLFLTETLPFQVLSLFLDASHYETSNLNRRLISVSRNQIKLLPVYLIFSP